MPLRLRRGNDSERQSITPQEGELIYVTDTKELWAGDGITQGGIKVTGNIPESLNDLSNVDLSVAPQIGQVLKWNGTAFVASNDIDTDTAGIVEGSNYRINILGSDSTVILDTESQTFNGDVTGSIFGDDSTILVDSVNSKIVGDIESASITSTNFIQFGTLTTIERNNLAAVAGMVIWNSDTIQFEGYNGTNWINLVDGIISV